MANEKKYHTKVIIETEFHNSVLPSDVEIEKDTKGKNYVMGKIAKVKSYNAYLSKTLDKDIYDIKTLAVIRPMILGVKSTTEATKIIKTETSTIEGEAVEYEARDAQRTKDRFKGAWEEFCSIYEKQNKKEAEAEAEKAKMQAEIDALKAKVKVEKCEEVEEVSDTEEIKETPAPEVKPKKRMGRPKGS